MTETTTYDDSAERPTDQPAAQALAPELQGHIGKHLRMVYGDLVKEPVPDRFKQLLDDLKRRDVSQREGQSAADSEENQQ